MQRPGTYTFEDDVAQPEAERKQADLAELERTLAAMKRDHRKYDAMAAQQQARRERQRQRGAVFIGSPPARGSFVEGLVRERASVEMDIFAELSGDNDPSCCRCC